MAVANSKTGLFSNISGDLFGGLTAGIVALPLALAFGEQTELGAIAGLYGSIAIGIIAAIFGGTKTQISGPTAPMTVVSAVVIATVIERVREPAQTVAEALPLAIPIIFATFAVAGLIQIIMGLLKLGRYVRFIPYPVVSGFMSGIGVIIVITQIFPFIGADTPGGGALGTIKSMNMVRENLNIWSIGLALAAIGLIYLTPRITKVVPGALVALLVLTPLVFLVFPEGAVTSLSSEGAIPSGLPALRLDLLGAFGSFDYLPLIFRFGATLAALGAIDSLLTSVVADNLTRTKHDSDRELIGQGIGNIGAAFIGGLPGAGATIRTVVNVNAGGRTRLSGVVAGAVLLLVLLGLGNLVGYIPNAVLAGILITVGIGIIDYKGLRHLTKVSKADGAVLIIVLILTVVVDLLTAVAVGMVLASLLFMKKASDQIEESSTSQSLADVLDSQPWADEDRSILERLGNRVFVKRVEGALFFGFASAFKQMLANLPEVDVVIIRMGRVPYMDQTGLYALEDAILDLERRGVKVLLTGVGEQPYDMMAGIGLIGGLVPNNHIFANFREAFNFLNKYHLQGIAEPAELDADASEIREA